MAITLGATITNGTADGASSLTISSHSIDSGANFLLVAIAVRGASVDPTPTAVTFGGDSMTKLGEIDAYYALGDPDNTKHGVSFWGLNSPSGTQNVSVTFAGTLGATATAMNFSDYAGEYGVVTPVVPDDTHGDVSSRSLSVITSHTNSIGITAIAVSDGSDKDLSPSPGGHTEVADVFSGTNGDTNGGIGQAASPGGTLTWSWSGGAPAIMAAVALYGYFSISVSDTITITENRSVAFMHPLLYSSGIEQDSVGFSISITVPDTPNRYLVVGVSTNRDVNFIHYDEVNMVDSMYTNAGDGSKHYLYGLPAPNVGTHTLSIGFVQLSAANKIVFWMLFTGVSQGIRVGATDFAAQTSGPVSNSVSLQYQNSITVEQQTLLFPGGSITESDSQTKQQEMGGATYTVAGATKAHASTGATTLGYSGTPSGTYFTQNIWEIVPVAYDTATISVSDDIAVVENEVGSIIHHLVVGTDLLVVAENVAVEKIYGVIAYDNITITENVNNFLQTRVLSVSDTVTVYEVKIIGKTVLWTPINDSISTWRGANRPIK